MGILLRISLRNLLRQKRRNLLLGAAIAIGMAMLVIANSFSHGISDVLFNRILTYMSGHVTVAFTQNGNLMRPVFNDGERMRALIAKALPNSSKPEEGVGLFARAIGNGRSDNVILVGMNPDPVGTQKQVENMKSDFFMLEGKYEDIRRTDLENPVLIASTKAAYLNVKVNDYLRVRFQDIHGRSQAVKLTVAGIFRPANVFMSAPVFLEQEKLKVLIGYGPHDIAPFHIKLPNPKKDAVHIADSIYSLLRPPLGVVFGQAEKEKGNMDNTHIPAPLNHKTTVTVTALGFHVDTTSLAKLTQLLKPIFPEGRVRVNKNDVMIGKALAESLDIRVGDACILRYRSKQDTGEMSVSFKVSAILDSSAILPGNSILINDKQFYGFYYEHWPQAPEVGSGAFWPDSTNPLYPLLSREWILLDRTRTTEAMQKKYREISRLKSKATTVDVQTMYENASMIIKLEYALNLITLVAVLILFFIIQVGVINTLRMTIRERTREIGTIRAIGMQKHAVRNIFLLETFFLSLFACLAGLLFAFVSMFGLSKMTFQQDGNPLSMLLVGGHLHFQPSMVGAILYLFLILMIAVVTAWFPSRTASNMLAADALRYYG